MLIGPTAKRVWLWLRYHILPCLLTKLNDSYDYCVIKTIIDVRVYWLVS